MKTNKNRILLLVAMGVMVAGWTWRVWRSDSALSYDLSKVVFDEQTYPVVVLGGGVAGLSAGLYCSQARVPCLIIEGSKGSALAQSHAVRNWPGVIEAPGKDIVDGLKKQVESSGIVHVAGENVMAVDLKQWPFVITTHKIGDKTKTRSIKALTVIVALGATPNMLDAEGIKTYWGKGVGNCALCDGLFYKDKVVAVVGGGDSAVEETVYLADIARTVYVIVRSDAFRAKDRQALVRMLALKNVEVLFNTHIKAIEGEGEKVTHAQIVQGADKKESQLALDGVFLAIGSQPNTSMLAGQLELDDKKYIVLKRSQETSVKGVYAAGDVADSEFVQAYSAGGDGYKAGFLAGKFLKSIGFVQSMVRGINQFDMDSTTLARPASLTTNGGAGFSAHPEYFAKQNVSKDKSDDHVEFVRTIETFDEFKKLVAGASRPIVVDVFSRLCIPCQQLMPVVHELAEDYKDKITVVKINIANKNADVSACLTLIDGDEIDSVPTLLFVKKGIEVARMTGLQEKKEIEAQIEKLLQK